MKQREKIWFDIQGLYCRKFAKEAQSCKGLLKMNYDYLKKGKTFLMKRTGDVSQFAGAKRYVLADGKAKGVEAVDIKTGTGFCFTVLPDRGMDIAWTSYRGMPISYITKSGIVGPAYYEPEGLNWIRGFFAGMLTTCGLTNVGSPCQDEHRGLITEDLGLHGRISYTPAENVCVQEQWEDDLLCMTVSGRMREGILHGEALFLTRTITAYLGQNKIHIDTESSSQKILVLQDYYHKDWHVYIDDKPGRIFPVNMISRGVVIPPGKHKVYMVYKPSGRHFYVTMTGYLIILILLVFELVIFLRKKKVSEAGEGGDS